MSLMPILHGGTVSAAVVLTGNNFDNSSDATPVYSGLKIDADGNLYEMTPNGGWSRFGTWLLAGTASTYYVSRTIENGILNNSDAGAGPLQLNADREYTIKTSAGELQTGVSFELSNDSSGSPVVASRTYVFLAEKTTGGEIP